MICNLQTSRPCIWIPARGKIVFKINQQERVFPLQVFFVTYEFSRELRPFLQLFVFRFIIRESQNKYFFEKLSDKPLLVRRKLVGSAFNIENNDPLAISMFLLGFHIQHCLSWWKQSSCYCFQESAQALVRAERVQTGTLNETSFFAAFMIYDSFCVTHHTGNRFFTLDWLLTHGRYSLY